MMSNHVANLAARIAFITLLILVIGASAVGLVGSSHAQETPKRNMRALLEKLDKDKRDIVIYFVKPIRSSQAWWAIPKDLKDDKGYITGRRFIGEIGDDYICIKELGQSAYDVTCVPFSNIADIEYFSS